MNQPHTFDPDCSCVPCRWRFSAEFGRRGALAALALALVFALLVLATIRAGAQELAVPRAPRVPEFTRLVVVTGPSSTLARDAMVAPPTSPVRSVGHDDVQLRGEPDGRGSVEQEILRRFGTRGQQALAKARCESHLNPRAENRSSKARGVFQVHPGHWDGRWSGKPRARVHGYTFDEMWDPVANIDWAYQHSHGGADWSEWEC